MHDSLIEIVCCFRSLRPTCRDFNCNKEIIAKLGHQYHLRQQNPAFPSALAESPPVLRRVKVPKEQMPG
jgi:hypothetical protein